jgi:hypothetical protein
MRTTFPSPERIQSDYASRLASATPETLRLAREWYVDANTFAHRLCEVRPDWNMEVSCSVISALSPRERWDSNKAKALAFANGEPIRGLGANLRRAVAAESHGFAALTGPKTRAFAEAIYGNPFAVVIDTWMLKCIGRKACTGPQYRLCADAVTIVGYAYGLTPRDAQAAIWIVERGSAE